MRIASRAKRLLSRTPVVRRAFANPLVDANWYVLTYPDVLTTGAHPATHYMLHGWAESRNPNPLFDTDWYLDHYPDVRASGENPLDHYLLHGGYEGRDPSHYFDSDWYLDENPDVRASGINPLLHFLAYGQREGRRPCAIPDAAQPEPSDGIRPRGILWARLSVLQRRRNAAANIRPLERIPPVVPQSEFDHLVEELESAPLGNNAIVAVAWARHGESPSNGLAWTSFPAADDPRPVFVSATAAIGHLEWHRHEGATHLAVPESAQHWFASLPAFAAHVERFPRLADLDDVLVFDLTRQRDGNPLIVDRLRSLVEEFRDRELRDPVILDLWSGFNFSGPLPEVQVFLPPLRQRPPYAYADASVDYVAFEAADGQAAADARRIAISGVLAVAVGGKSGWAVDIESSTRRPGEKLPSVSIVIPTHNGVALVKRCLDAIEDSVPSYYEVEVIVTDDGSEPSSRDALVEIVGQHARARLVRSETNLGFVGATNLGAGTAQGELMVLLNDDTLPMSGWLSALAQTLRQHPDAGAVGGRLVYPGGRLQEAGGIIFADGSGANFGRNAVDPDAPEFTYVREVDYVSGALLATPAALFRSLGGLDPLYGFGYYDDADYSFKLRRNGYRTYYQPHSVVIHIEGASAGTDTSVGPKRSQIENRSLFTRRYAAELADQPPVPASATFEALAAIADRAGR